MAKTNDTENPSQHQQSPPSALQGTLPTQLAATRAEIATLENFLNYQLDMATCRPDDYIQVTGGQLGALSKLLKGQVANIQLTLRQELSTLNLHLPHTEDTETAVTLAMWAVETQLQATLDEVRKITGLCQQLEEQLQVPKAAA